MRQGLTLSILLHVAILLIGVFGVPIFMPPKPLPEPIVISVDILPISSITNVKPSKQAPSKAPPKKADKPKKATPKVNTEKAKPTPPKPKADTVKIPQKDAKPKPKEKKKEEKKPAKDDLAAVLKAVEKTAEAEKPKEAPKEKPKETGTSNTKTKTDKKYNAALPLSISEKDAILNQFVRCWRMPAGSANDYSLAVLVRVLLLPDGSVQNAGITKSQAGRYTSDPVFRAAADAALRAVWACNPIQGLPPEKYETWKDIEFNFDPRNSLY